MSHPAIVLLVTFPIQGQINPSLQFAKRLLRMGIKVIFATSGPTIQRMMKNTPTLQGLTFAALPDGSDDGSEPSDDIEQYVNKFKARGSGAIEELIRIGANQGRPITRVIYTTFLSWVPNVARGLHVPSTLLWIQPATVFDIYYYYYNGYCGLIDNITKDPSCLIELPGLPPLTSRELPSFLLPWSADRYALEGLQQHFEILGLEKDPHVLVNTFEALENKALRAIDKISVIPIGPLIPSAFLDGKYPSDSSFGGDLFEKSIGYKKWLHSMPKSSVLYVSFGTISMISKRQMEEIARGLLDSGQPFLWVIRRKENEDSEEEKLSCIKELEKQGMIVTWCSQLDVLSDPSIGCFLTHCGWNSSLEGLVSGVPVVVFPQQMDQGTNAKLIEDVSKTGVRVTPNEEGIVCGKEIKRCIDIVMGGGERGLQMRNNAKKWKELAREAVKEGGSTDINLRAFVGEKLKPPTSENID